MISNIKTCLSYPGEVLRGDRIVNTPYEVQMAENITCRLLCNRPTSPINWSESESQKVVSRIEHEYNVHLLVGFLSYFLLS